MSTELCMSSISRCCALRTMQGGPRSLCVSRQVAFDKPRSSKPTLARTRKQVVVMIASAIIPPQTPAAQGMLDLAKTLASKTDERVQIRASALCYLVPTPWLASLFGCGGCAVAGMHSANGRARLRDR